jgi:hypothetical protein
MNFKSSKSSALISLLIPPLYYFINPFINDFNILKRWFEFKLWRPWYEPWFISILYTRKHIRACKCVIRTPQPLFSHSFHFFLCILSHLKVHIKLNIYMVRYYNNISVYFFFNNANLIFTKNLYIIVIILYILILSDTLVCNV